MDDDIGGFDGEPFPSGSVTENWSDQLTMKVKVSKRYLLDNFYLAREVLSSSWLGMERVIFWGHGPGIQYQVRAFFGP